MSDFKKKYLKFVKKQESIGERFQDKQKQLKYFYFLFAENFSNYINKKKTFSYRFIWGSRIWKINNF